jgi:hypothetical protein
MFSNPPTHKLVRVIFVFAAPTKKSIAQQQTDAAITASLRTFVQANGMTAGSDPRINNPPETREALTELRSMSSSLQPNSNA